MDFNLGDALVYGFGYVSKKGELHPECIILDAFVLIKA